MGVLHANKGDGKIRGHLGSEIKNKFDFVFNIAQREKNNYLLSHPTGRFPTIPDLGFSRTDELMPVYEKAWQKTIPKFSDEPPPLVRDWNPTAGITANRINDEDIPF